MVISGCIQNTRSDGILLRVLKELADVVTTHDLDQGAKALVAWKWLMLCLYERQEGISREFPASNLSP